MSVKIFLLFIILGSVLSAISWLMVIINIDPNQAGFWGKACFYLSLFLVLLGIFAIFSFWFRRRFTKGQMIYRQLNTSLRQAIFFSILIIGMAMLQRQKLLNWWTTLLFIATLTVLELFFIIYSRQKKYLSPQNENTNSI